MNLFYQRSFVCHGILHTCSQTSHRYPFLKNSPHRRNTLLKKDCETLHLPPLRGGCRGAGFFMAVKRTCSELCSRVPKAGLPAAESEAFLLPNRTVFGVRIKPEKGSIWTLKRSQKSGVFFGGARPDNGACVHYSNSGLL